MTSGEMKAIVDEYLSQCEQISIDKDMLPSLLQTLGMRRCGDVLALWELDDVDGYYHFEVRLGTDPAGPLVTEWTYRPAA